MRSLFATLTIFGKITLLGCFSLFGGYCGTAEAATVSPCHQSATENIFDQGKEAPCGQCEHSVETWSEPITCPFTSEKEISAVIVLPLYELQEELIVQDGAIEPFRVPPEDLFVKTLKQIARSTEWRSSGC